jgi:hypothetical protein
LQNEIGERCGCPAFASLASGYLRVEMLLLLSIYHAAEIEVKASQKKFSGIMCVGK